MRCWVELCRLILGTLCIMGGRQVCCVVQMCMFEISQQRTGDMFFWKAGFVYHSRRRHRIGEIEHGVLQS